MGFLRHARITQMAGLIESSMLGSHARLVSDELWSVGKGLMKGIHAQDRHTTVTQCMYMNMQSLQSIMGTW